MKFKKIATIILSCGIGAAGVADAITGRVVNSTSNGLANTKVWLKNNPSISDSTDNDGKFSLELPSTKIISSHATSKQNSFFNVHNNRIMFALPTTQAITLDLFDIEGKRVTSFFNGIAGPDMISINLNSITVQLASGMYILKCTGHNMRRALQKWWLYWSKNESWCSKWCNRYFPRSPAKSLQAAFQWNRYSMDWHKRFRKIFGLTKYQAHLWFHLLFRSRPHVQLLQRGISALFWWNF